MCVIDKLRLRESIGIIPHESGIDFFKSNTRENLSLKIDFPDIVNLLNQFDGKTSIERISEKHGFIDVKQLNRLASYLKEQFILIQQDMAYPIELLENDFRLINLLEDYFHSTSDVVKAVGRLKNSTVMIIGLGAVGSIISAYLTKNHVGNLILVDSDIVDLSNLHRQYYFESHVGLDKATILKKELKGMNPDVNIKVISQFLTSDFFEKNQFPNNIDLIINCSDEPSVDATSRVIAKYAMNHNIPHIVGGGYNLHLTLIGQTIIPFQSACFDCFKTALNSINENNLKNVKVLNRNNRKLGSFSPLSGIAASLASLDAFKILINRYDMLQQTNKRIEFNSIDFSMQIMNIIRNPECEWCGE